MAKTLVDVDDDMLGRVADLLGTRTKKDTINAALGEVIALDARRKDVAWLREGGLKELAEDLVREAMWQ